MKCRRQFLKSIAALSLAPSMAAYGADAMERNAISIGTVLVVTAAAGQLLPKYLKEVGVKADVVVYPNTTVRMQTIASGDSQLGYGGVSAAIALASRGSDVTLLANACEGGSNLVGKSKFKKLEDLKGHGVAVKFGTTGHAELQWKLQNLGLTDQVELINMNDADMVVPLQRGDIDAGFMTEPYPSIVTVNGWGGEIWLPYDTPIGKTNLAMVSTVSFIKKNPNLARACVRAHKQATEELLRDPSISLDVMIKSMNVARPVAEAAMHNTFFTNDSGANFRKEVQAMGEIMLQAKSIQKLPDWKVFFSGLDLA